MKHNLSPGMKFGRLTIIKKASRGGYECTCSCGNLRIVKAYNLVNRIVLSCGCYGKEQRGKAIQKNILGKRFGNLIVIDRIGTNYRGDVEWLCQCDCGQKTTVTTNLLISGHTKSCGCLQKRMASASARKNSNLVGMRFGRLTVIEETGKNRWGSVIWRCQCDCGNETNLATGVLKHGDTTSCGCYNKDRLRETHRTHGLSRTPEYDRAWQRSRREKEKNLDVAWFPEMEFAILEMFPECVWCGSSKNLSIDHVYPLSMGYGLRPGNATVLCTKCNNKKNKKDPNSLSEEKRDILFRTAEEFRAQWMD